MKLYVLMFFIGFVCLFYSFCYILLYFRRFFHPGGGVSPGLRVVGESVHRPGPYMYGSTAAPCHFSIVTTRRFASCTTASSVTPLWLPPLKAVCARTSLRTST